MAAAEHSGPNGHEVCNGVVSIADEFLKVICNQSASFRVIELHPTSKSSLGEKADLGDDQLIEFFRYEMHRGWAIAIARCGGEPELEPELEPGVQLI